MKTTKRRRLARLFLLVMLVPALTACALVWLAGSVLLAPAHQAVGKLPSDLPGETVSFQSASHTTLRGWLVPGKPGRGVVVLLHGVRGNRRHVLDRARFLHRAGYGVLVFDFQAHGESGGEFMTFGARESEDARAAVQLVQQRFPREKIGVIGVSLGGAAALLADPPLPVQALVLEMTYPAIDDAVRDRLRIVLGDAGPAFAPLLLQQMQPRMGVSPEQLRPVEKVARLSTPKLFIAGAKDRHTPLAESRQMFERAQAPKALWVVPDAAHVNLYGVAPREYEQRVSTFFQTYLTQGRKR